MAITPAGEHTACTSHVARRGELEKPLTNELASMSREPLRFATYLAPCMLPFYQAVSGYIGRKLGCATSLAVGTSFGQFAAGEVDAGFI
jgi:hypothetical protein